MVIQPVRTLLLVAVVGVSIYVVTERHNERRAVIENERARTRIFIDLEISRARSIDANILDSKRTIERAKKIVEVNPIVKPRLNASSIPTSP